MLNTLYHIIGLPFGYLMRLIYMVIPNYAWAIIIFTLVTKLLFFPISYKTQKGAARMRLIQPKIQKLQKSYASNPTLLQQKTQELYAQEGYNPMGSCLPSIIQMLLLFGVIDVVYKPITHILHLGESIISAAASKASELVTTLGLSNINSGRAFDTNNLRHELFTMEVLEKHYDEFGSISGGFAEKVSEFIHNFTLFGANLGKTPTMHPEVWNREAVILCLIPWLAGLAQLLVSIYSMYFQRKTNPTQQAGGGCMVIMMLLMPILSIVWGFSLPAGVGFYWIWSSLFSFLITFSLNKYFTLERISVINEKEKEKARIYAEKHPGKKTFMQRMLEQQAALEQQSGAGTKPNGEKMSRSEANKANRDAIKEARRRMAEKYGDVYDDNDDNDD